MFVPALLAFLSVTVAVPAQEAGSEEKKPSKAALEKYDADGDGQLNEAEKARRQADITAKAQETKRRNLEKYDANGNGKLDPEEKAKREADELAAKEAKKADRAAKDKEVGK